MNNHSDVYIFGDQVSGKSPKYTDPTNLLIYKKISQREREFYEWIQDIPIHNPCSALRCHLPTYKGIIKMSINQSSTVRTDSPEKKRWIEHIQSRQNKEQQDFIMMENLLANYAKPCLLDIKLGIKKEKKSNVKFANSTTNSHRFRMNGLSTYQHKTGQSFFITKYYGQKVTEQETEVNIAFFFFDGHEINIPLLESAISEVKALVLSLLLFNQGAFNSSSLFICYDALNPLNFKVKFIDFDKYQATSVKAPDNNMIIGLKNLLQYLINIVNNRDQHIKTIKNKELKLYYDYEFIPQHKIDQYEKKKDKKKKQE